MHSLGVTLPSSVPCPCPRLCLPLVPETSIYLSVSHHIPAGLVVTEFQPLRVRCGAHMLPACFPQLGFPCKSLSLPQLPGENKPAACGTRAPICHPLHWLWPSPPPLWHLSFTGLLQLGFSLTLKLHALASAGVCPWDCGTCSGLCRGLSLGLRHMVSLLLPSSPTKHLFSLEACFWWIPTPPSPPCPPL